MAPDLERKMKEEIERANLQEVTPGFDAEQEWQTLDSKLRPRRTVISLKVWRYAAAAAILIIAGAIAMFVFRPGGTEIVKHTAPIPVNNTGGSKLQPDTGHKESPATGDQTPLAVHDQKQENNGQPVQKVSKKYMISNSTDCPMEISISQTMKCPNSQPAAISTSSTLEPGQSAPLGYKEIESVPKNCSLTVEQIEITSLSTGEAITLDAHSSPTTAGEVFSYISGEKRGDVLAGVFNLDCNKHTKKHSLRLDNRAGSIVMQ